MVRGSPCDASLIFVEPLFLSDLSAWESGSAVRFPRDHRQVAAFGERLEERLTDGEDPSLGHEELAERRLLGQGPNDPKSAPCKRARPPVTNQISFGFASNHWPFGEFP